MGIVFGKNARATGVYKGIAWAYQYVNEEASLVLVKASMATKGMMHATGAAVIGLDMAWKYRGDRASDLPVAVPNWMNVAHAIGLDPRNDRDVKLVGDVIEHLLEGVVKMKPMPQHMQRQMQVDDVQVDGRRIVIQATA